MTCKEIKDKIDNHLSLDISIKIRSTFYVELRYIYYQLCLKYASDALSYRRIGKEVNKDHASVMHGLGKFEDFLLTDNDFATKYYDIEQIIISVVPKEIIDRRIKIEEYKKQMLTNKYLDLQSKYFELKCKYNYLNQKNQ